MQISIWIFLAALLGFVAFEFVRGTRIGKKEQKRVQALFKRITECPCPFCGRTYGSLVEKRIQISFNDENQLPSTLAAVEHLHTWRISCPHCEESALLAENEGIFELLKVTIPLAAEKGPSPAYLALVALLCLAVVGVSIYSLVHFFMR